MRKIEAKILIRKDGKLGTVKVQAYTRDGVWCFHRDYYNPKLWRMSSILRGMSDGREYKTRENALVHICQPEWRDKCDYAANQIDETVDDYPEFD